MLRRLVAFERVKLAKWVASWKPGRKLTAPGNHLKVFLFNGRSSAIEDDGAMAPWAARRGWPYRALSARNTHMRGAPVLPFDYLHVASPAAKRTGRFQSSRDERYRGATNAEKLP